MLECTFFTQKPRLSFAVELLGAPAFRTFLACISWVNIFDKTTINFRFVIKKRLQSCKTPGVNSSACFLSCFNSISNVSQILKNNCCTMINAINYSSRQNVITICAETVYLPAKFLQMSLGRLGAFRLQSTFQIKISMFYFFPLASSKEKPIASHCRSVNAKIYAQYLISRLKVFARCFYNNMQKSFTILKYKIRRANLPSNSCFVKFRNNQCTKNPTASTGQSRSTSGKIDACRSCIISNYRRIRIRTRRSSSLSKFCFSTFNRLCSPYTRGTDKLAWKLCNRSLIGICHFMQFNSIEPIHCPSHITNSVIRVTTLLCSIIQNIELIGFYWKLKCQSYHVIFFHICSIIHCWKSVNQRKEARLLPDINVEVSALKKRLWSIYLLLPIKLQP